MEDDYECHLGVKDYARGIKQKNPKKAVMHQVKNDAIFVMSL